MITRILTILNFILTTNLLKDDKLNLKGSDRSKYFPLKFSKKKFFYSESTALFFN